MLAPALTSRYADHMPPKTVTKTEPPTVDFVLPTPLPEVAGEKVTSTGGQVVMNHFPSRVRRSAAIAAYLGVDRSVVHRAIYDIGLEVIESKLDPSLLAAAARKAKRTPRRSVAPKS